MRNTSILWPEWETVRLIGRGSFGSVYEIQRNIFGDIESAALKVISIPQNASDIDELYSEGYDEESITSTFDSHLKSIVAEYSLMRKMNGSANVVNCDDIRYIRHDDGIGWDIFIKMELLTPLTKVLPDQIPEEMVIKLAKDMCSALELCKKHGIIHRDIKPQNIFVSPNGDYKLGDFGVAKTVEKTMGGTKIGTFKYMAPEVYNNEPYGAAADIYSLGLVLYWMLNERRMPFLPLPPEKLSATMEDDARDRRFKGDPLDPPKNGSQWLKEVVLKACAYDPKDRYADASQMLADLQARNIPDSPLGSGGKMPPEVITTHLDVYQEITFAHDDNPAGMILSAEICGKTVHFTVPGDIKDGQMFCVPEKGRHDAATGVKGDLYVTVHIKPAPKEFFPMQKIIIAAAAIIAIVSCLLFFTEKKTDKQPDSQNEGPQVSVTEAHTHSWEIATCTTPQTCSGCGETIGSASGHQWVEATYDAPKTCSNCGLSEGRSKGTYLIKCGCIDDSNVRGSKTDVNIGNWQDCFGTTHNNALRFWVSGRGNLSNTEYIVYRLDEKYSELDVSVQLADDSHTSATAFIKIYADGKILEISQTVDRNSSAVTFTLDVTGVDQLRIECVTDSSKDAYCIVDALLYVV